MHSPKRPRWIQGELMDAANSPICQLHPWGSNPWPRLWYQFNSWLFVHIPYAFIPLYGFLYVPIHINLLSSYTFIHLYYLHIHSSIHRLFCSYNSFIVQFIFISSKYQFILHFPFKKIKVRIIIKLFYIFLNININLFLLFVHDKNKINFNIYIWRLKFDD